LKTESTAKPEGSWRGSVGPKVPNEPHANAINAKRPNKR